MHGSWREKNSPFQRDICDRNGINFELDYIKVKKNLSFALKILK